MAMPKAKVEGELREEVMRNLALRRLIKNDMGWTKTARETGVPKTTLRRWWEALNDDERDDLRTVVDDEVTAMWRAVEDAALAEMLKRIPGMKDHDLTVTAGIAADKAMKYSGIADAGVMSVRIEPNDIADEIEGVLAAVRERMSAEGIPQSTGASLRS